MLTIAFRVGHTLRETVVMMPFALGYFGYLTSHHALAFTSFGVDASVLMMLAGPLTVVPLALYAYAMPLVSLTVKFFGPDPSSLIPTPHELLFVLRRNSSFEPSGLKRKKPWRKL